MSAILAWLKGKKTYILSAVGLVAVLLHSWGVISDSIYNLVLGLLGSGALASIRAALPK